MGVALDPDTENFLWYSVQEVFERPDGRLSLDALLLISWLVRDESADALPDSNTERIALLKRRAANSAEPLRSNIMDIPNDSEARPLRMGDFAPQIEGCSEFSGSVTLAEDASHAMTMYRG
ncbi:hypothetical protein VPNG_09861 [Cytospora leucostoma]|uniref:Uncharacterized protein n=1 Tax=Cytospora leucostoma TaxID=1230097 RepID=A0A423VIL7_9PEZI|nr:hypothetical protein VPNG_09861 [Cytospora leucostoma]